MKVEKLSIYQVDPSRLRHIAFFRVVIKGNFVANREILISFRILRRKLSSLHSRVVERGRSPSLLRKRKTMIRHLITRCLSKETLRPKRQRRPMSRRDVLVLRLLLQIERKAVVTLHLSHLLLQLKLSRKCYLQQVRFYSLVL